MRSGKGKLRGRKYKSNAGLLIVTGNNEKLKICFDMGNSASYDHDPESTLKKISNYLGSVHIKDRKLNGRSVPLGKGRVDFNNVFSSLDKMNFNGPVSYQVHRNKNSDNVSVLKHSITFINNIIENIHYG